MRLHPAFSLLDNFLSEGDEALGTALARGVFRPPLDLLERGDHYEVVVDLPGVSKDELEIEFADGVLTLRGEREVKATAEQEARAFRQERGRGKFGRSVSFYGEELDVDKIEADFHDGVLHIKVPKSEKQRPRQIPLKVVSS